MLSKIKSLYIRYKEIVNYIIVGGMTTAVSLGSYYVCVLFFLNPRNALLLQIANVISWICAVTFAYITNRKYVFESQNTDKIYEVAKFVGARLFTLVIDVVCMALMVSILGLNDKLAKIIIQFIVLILNYILSKIIVFRKNNI